MITLPVTLILILFALGFRCLIIHATYFELILAEDPNHPGMEVLWVVPSAKFYWLAILLFLLGSICLCLTFPASPPLGA